MLICMRTTLNLDDHLVARLKREALTRRTTLTRLIEDAIRQSLEPRPAVAPPHEFHLFAGAQALAVDIADRNALEDWLEGDHARARFRP